MGQVFRPQRLHQPTPLNPAVMAQHVMEFAPASDAEALKLLRTRYPDAPLSLRVAALNFLMRRKPQAALPRL